MGVASSAEAKCPMACRFVATARHLCLRLCPIFGGFPWVLSRIAAASPQHLRMAQKEIYRISKKGLELLSHYKK
jgi:hypothetical protein